MQPDEQPFQQSNLDSSAYRKRLLRKLNTLIAVLEVACAKVRLSLQGPAPDVERLTRVHRNLKNTLQICQRAKTALQRSERLPDGLPPILGLDPGLDLAEDQILHPAPDDLGSPDEKRKFAGLPPITRDEIRVADLDALCNRLLLG